MELVFKIFLLLGGLALFLYGMKLMSDGLEAAAGSKFKNILELVTKNRFIAVLTGTFITAIVQSSSATTVMVVGFVNAGLMKLTQAVGVVMGANIGTTITGIIVSLKVSDYAPLAIFIGVMFIIAAKRDKMKFQGQIIAGLGILFLGMSLMGDTLKPLSSNETAVSMFEYAQNPFIGILIGLAFTAMMQSSSATMGIVITLGMSGLLDLSSAIFIVYGSNIGTCVTALLATIGASKAARKVAVVHFSFNIIGTVIFTAITLLPFGYVSFLESLSAENVGAQIALSSVVFNITTTVLLFPFANILVKIADFVIPIGEDDDKLSKKLLHLDPRLLTTSHIAADQTYKEVERMARLALENYKLSIDTFLNRNQKNSETVKKNEEVINFLNHEITKFLIKVGALELEDSERKLIGSLFHVVNDIERIGDHAENIVEFSLPFIEKEITFSPVAIEELKSVSDKVEEVLAEAINIFANKVYDKEVLGQIAQKEDEVDNKVQQSKDNHVERLNKGLCTPDSGMLFINMLDDLERVSDHAINIANPLRIGKKSLITERF